MPSSICGLLAVVFLAAGCASVGEKTKFYTLSVPSDTRGKDPYPGYSVTPIFIEVMPVSVPERLARPQLVVSSKGQDGELLFLNRPGGLPRLISNCGCACCGHRGENWRDKSDPAWPASRSADLSYCG